MFISDYGKEDYYIYLKKYKEISIARGSYLRHKELINNNFSLPDARWFIKNCPNDEIENFSDFVEWCGFIPTHGMSKEKVIEVVYEMQSELDRPLMYDDFRNPNHSEIGVGYIRKYWGTMNKMKKELGLEIIQENMVVRTKSLYNAMRDIKEICNNIYKHKKIKVISIDDFNNYKNSNQLTYQTYYKYFKNNNNNIRDYINKLGFYVINAGCGMMYRYEDNETVFSRFEFQFTNF